MTFADFEFEMALRNVRTTLREIDRAIEEGDAPEAYELAKLLKEEAAAIPTPEESK